jgi:hypothetical protein
LGKTGGFGRRASWWWWCCVVIGGNVNVRVPAALVVNRLNPPPNSTHHPLDPSTAPQHNTHAEPLVAVYLRGDAALSSYDDEEDMLAFNTNTNTNASGKEEIRSPAVNKLFQRFNRKPKPAAA